MSDFKFAPIFGIQQTGLTRIKPDFQALRFLLSTIATRSIHRNRWRSESTHHIHCMSFITPTSPGLITISRLETSTTFPCELEWMLSPHNVVICVFRRARVMIKWVATLVVGLEMERVVQRPPSHSLSLVRVRIPSHSFSSLGSEMVEESGSSPG